MSDVLSDASIRQIPDAYKHAHAPYEPLQPEQLEIMDGLFPIMQMLHRANKTIEGALPSNHPEYPGHAATLGAYYMNGHDPNTLGKWQLRVTDASGSTSLKAIIDATPGEVTDFSIGIVTDKKYAPATQEDHGKVFSVLGLMTGAIESHEPRRRRSVVASVGAFTRRYIGKAAA